MLNGLRAATDNNSVNTLKAVSRYSNPIFQLVKKMPTAFEHKFRLLIIFFNSKLRYQLDCHCFDEMNINEYMQRLNFLNFL